MIRILAWMCSLLLMLWRRGIGFWFWIRDFSDKRRSNETDPRGVVISGHANGAIGRNALCSTSDMDIYCLFTIQLRVI